MACLVLLTSCWLPDHFLAEVRLGRNGDYALTYKGELVWAPLVQEIKGKKLSAVEIQEKTQALLRDLKRDNGFKEIRSLGQGRFAVLYERSGRLGPRDQMVFVRRTDPLIIIETFEDGRAMVRSQALKSSQREQIAQAGLHVTGKFRVVTDAKPLRGNPKHVTARGFQNFVAYDWDISLSAERPVLEVDLKSSAPPPVER
ncbi:hypothetical protein [Pararhodospirillum photometricum]|uniref:hypothetical protein n=1 Tax=Pararhodospirillum photometricum TaxID=1084 RepID=UPI0003035608|nr:hypothetical protein [Pararhodospirillum photometricum]